MAQGTQARRLKQHIASLETMTRFVLATLALGSGVYTYLGVRSLLDGSATAVFFAAVIYAVSVSVAIYGFWTYMIRFFPEMRDGGSRMAMLGIMAVGSAMIVAMASWLNAAALAGSAAVEQHLAITLEDYTADLDQAHGNALGALSLLPDIQRAGERFARLAEQEQTSGALTGTSGSGSVVQLLSQMSAQMKELEARSRLRVRPCSRASSRARNIWRKMRGLVSAPGPIEARSDEFAAESVALSGVIASLEQTSIAPSVNRAAADLSVGFIAPVADGDSRRSGRPSGRSDGDDPHLRRRAVQGASRRRRRKSWRSRKSRSAASCRCRPPTPFFAMPSDFIPSWAGAIAIDLLPAVLVGVMAVAHSAARRDEEDAGGCRPRDRRRHFPRPGTQRGDPGEARRAQTDAQQRTPRS